MFQVAVWRYFLSVLVYLIKTAFITVKGVNRD